MISDHLIPALKTRFALKPFVFGKPPAAIATLPAPCEEVGRLEIEDDDHEVTVYLSKIAHGHFGCYDEALTKEEKEKEIAGDVVRFLDDLFADRVVLYKRLKGVVSGWEVLSPSASAEASTPFCQRYLWSRKL